LMGEDSPRATVTVEEIESLLSRLSGVISSRVVINNWGAIEEVHILANTDRSPKQVVRDVESSLAARWGITIDHKKISVAQLSGGSAQGPTRVKLLNVVVTNDTQRNRLCARVELGKLNDSGPPFEGVAEGNNSRYQALKVVCQSTVNALNRVIDPQNVFVPEDVGTMFLAGQEVAVVAVSLVTSRGNEEILIGAAPIKSDWAEAVVKATLDAANRRLGKIQPRGRDPETPKEGSSAQSGEQPTS